MIKYTPLALLAVIIMLVAAIIFGSQSANAGSLNPRWEYTYVGQFDTLARINQLGQEGWEMSGVCRDWVYFKRRI